MEFQEVNARELKNVFEYIADDWALVTAGTPEKWNTMTVSWGAMGEMWGKDAAFVFIRPQRYTKVFVDANERFTISNFDGGFKKELGVCGSKSGRDIDKSAETGLTAGFIDGVPYIEQAHSFVICRKMAEFDITPDMFTDKTIDGRWYPAKDYHRAYIAEIEKAYMKK